MAYYLEHSISSIIFLQEDGVSMFEMHTTSDNNFVKIYKAICVINIADPGGERRTWGQQTYDLTQTLNFLDLLLWRFFKPNINRNMSETAWDLYFYAQNAINSFHVLRLIFSIYWLFPYINQI